MNKKTILHHTMNRRSILIGAGQVLLGSVLLGRMGYLQIWQADHYKTLANGNRIKIQPILPKRGIIIDRKGAILAHNQKQFRAVLDLQEFENTHQTITKLSKVLNLSQTHFETLMQQLQSKANPKIILKDNLTWIEVARLETHLPELVGLHVEEAQTRFYPLGLHTAHLIGYVQAPTASELTHQQKIHLGPGYTVGKLGIEKYQNQTLQGHAGYQEIETNARHQPVRVLKTQKSTAGHDLKLSVDLDLQNFVQSRLSEERSASAILMDIHDGEIIALCSHPSFDPNPFSTGLSQNEWQALLENPYKPLINKAIRGEYPPGSIFKLVVAIAALEQNLISPTEKIFCPGHFEVSNHRFHCVRSSGHGHLNLTHAIAQSCDVYFYTLALRIGIDKIAETANLLGFGLKTGLELEDEKTGLVPTKKWKQHSLGKPWFIGETIVAAIGQGYVQATPLQMAVMLARIANGGYKITPHLLQHASTQNTNPTQVISTRSLKPILQGLNLAVNNPMGTGYRARILQPSLAMAGKTSTSQVRSIGLTERKQKKHRLEQPWKWRDHSIFVGYAPLNQPKYVTAVVVEHGGWGSRIAAPIARDILQETQAKLV